MNHALQLTLSRSPSTHKQALSSTHFGTLRIKQRVNSIMGEHIQTKKPLFWPVFLITLHRVTQDDIHGTTNSTVNGIDGWAEKAIAGRGILVDYVSWAAEQGVPYNPMTSHPITVDEIKAIFAARNIQPRQGDILFLRTGYVSAYMSLDTAGKEGLLTADHAWPGLKQGEEMTRWLWGQQFAAIAADNPALECIRKSRLRVESLCSS